MDYNQFIEELKQKKEFQRVLEFILGLKNKRVYYFSHDDPDGLTSATIMTELFKYLNIEYKLFFPSNFALRDEDIPDDNYDAIVVTDKGTLAEYDRFYKENKGFLTIDHHYSPKTPEKILWYNPSITEKNAYCSASYIVHTIASALGFRNEYTDFWAMVGLKGDWAIDPAIDMIAPYTQPLYEEFSKNFPNLVEKRKDLPATMFEASQREYSTLLSVYTHQIHGISGGAFQYFYNNRDERLQNIFQPQLAYDLLLEIKYNGINLRNITQPNDFYRGSKYKEITELILHFYEEDWNNGMQLLNTAVRLRDIKDTQVFLYMGKEMNLMPMLGSIALFDFTKGKDGIFIMAAKVDYGIHFSVRATGGVIHSGKLCGYLAEQLKNTVDEDKKSYISGGGHPKAAECNVKIRDYEYDKALKIFLEIYAQMKEHFDMNKWGV